MVDQTGNKSGSEQGTDDIVKKLRDIAARCWCAEKSQGEPVGKPFFRCESCDDQLIAADTIEQLEAIVANVDALPERKPYDGYDDYHIGYNAALRDIRRALRLEEHNDG